ncbi:hypothetical protein OUZ56_016929 [Daphnia magna]|uniref:Uncharacterized protein n=1 Tax=Daphnia magna TaxID=35525 RepID=A0ABR0ARN9_9CRUS|nr:hypothetical protein OUZ56_016929 [Daphnia magna]
MHNRWDDYAALNQLSSYPAAEGMAALRMYLNPSMQQVVEIVLGILATTPTTPNCGHLPGNTECFAELAGLNSPAHIAQRLPTPNLSLTSFGADTNAPARAVAKTVKLVSQNEPDLATAEIELGEMETKGGATNEPALWKNKFTGNQYLTPTPVPIRGSNPGALFPNWRLEEHVWQLIHINSAPHLESNADLQHHIQKGYTYAIDSDVNIYRQLEHKLNCFGNITKPKP